jgi:hypothetical protein
MFVRMTRTKRLRAGRFVALIYLLCVLAPTISFALPGSQALAPCLIDATHPPGMIREHTELPTQHVHNDSRWHDHSGGHSHAISDDAGGSVSMVLDGKQVPEKAPHSSDGQCCGLTCVTALPATLVDILQPSAPISVCDPGNYRNAADNAPPRHYRPPIS